MQRATRIFILIVLTVVCIIVVLLLKPMPQDTAYHQFADQRTIAGIPYFANVLSNLPFLIVGFYGLSIIKKSQAPLSIKKMYAVLFAGIFLTGLGSAYYHLAPSNARLVFDRIPMTIVFMAFLSATIAAWIDIKTGAFLLIPLLLLGIASVLWWYHTELNNAGDLRFYGFIQFYPILLAPFIFILFASPEKSRGLRLLIWVIAWYGVAKIFETWDIPVYKHSGFISGHSLKHIAAAAATWYIVQFFKKKYIPAY
jgi:hypothetical protein